MDGETISSPGFSRKNAAVVGDPRGVRLSGSQAKRIPIARALLRDAPIVLLDELTSGLDPSSENLVTEAFDRLMEHRTIIMVSHHLPIIANSDLIVVVRRGRIVEMGTHRGLVQNGSGYRRFWEGQVGTVMPDTGQSRREDPGSVMERSDT